jgi:hypothetical protein
MNQFISSQYYPANWSEFLTLPGVETYANSGDFNGCRSTYVPVAPVSGASGSFGVIGNQNVAGSVSVCILRTVGSSSASNSSPVARLYYNMECTPFQDTYFLFDPTVDLCDPSAMVQGLLKAGDFLQAVGNTIDGFEKTMGVGVGTFLMKKAGRFVDYISSVFGMGAAGGAASSDLRMKAFLQCALHYAKAGSYEEYYLRRLLTLPEVQQSGVPLPLVVAEQKDDGFETVSQASLDQPQSNAAGQGVSPYETRSESFRGSVVTRSVLPLPEGPPRSGVRRVGPPN